MTWSYQSIKQSYLCKCMNGLPNQYKELKIKITRWCYIYINNNILLVERSGRTTSIVFLVDLIISPDILVCIQKKKKKKKQYLSSYKVYSCTSWKEYLSSVLEECKVVVRSWYIRCLCQEGKPAGLGDKCVPLCFRERFHADASCLSMLYVDEHACPGPCK